MRAVMTERHTDEEPWRFAPPLAWGIAAAAIMSVFAVVAIVVNYAPLNREVEKRVGIELPPETFGTLAALVKASGNTCAHVCSVTPVTSLTAASTLDIACSDARKRACDAPIHYRINVERNAGPQR